jgi:hypothetical protein
MIDDRAPGFARNNVKGSNAFAIPNPSPPMKPRAIGGGFKAAWFD